MIARNAFVAGALDTGYIDREGAALPAPDDEPWVLACVGVVAWRMHAAAQRSSAPWALRDGWRLNATAEHRLTLAAGEAERAFTLRPTPSGWRVLGADLEADVQLVTMEGPDLTVCVDGLRRRISIVPAEDAVWLCTAERTVRFAIVNPLTRADTSEAEVQGDLRSPMPGKIVSVDAAAGDRVASGQTLMTLEAMKMEHTITAPFDGRVTAVHFRPGDVVDEGAQLARIEAES